MIFSTLVSGLLLACTSVHAAGSRVSAVSGGELTFEGRGEALKPGDGIPNGRKLKLSAGAAVLAFSDYGKILVKGPAIFDLTAGGMELQWGWAQFVFGSTQYGFLLNTQGISVGPPYGEPFTAYAEVRQGGELFFCLCDGNGRYGPEIEGNYARPLPGGRPHAAYLLKRSGEKSVSLKPYQAEKKSAAKSSGKEQAKSAEQAPLHHDDASIARLR